MTHRKHMAKNVCLQPLGRSLKLLDSAVDALWEKDGARFGNSFLQSVEKATMEARSCLNVPIVGRTNPMLQIRKSDLESELHQYHD